MLFNYEDDRSPEAARLNLLKLLCTELFEMSSATRVEASLQRGKDRHGICF